MTIILFIWIVDAIWCTQNNTQPLKGCQLAVYVTACTADASLTAARANDTWNTLTPMLASLAHHTHTPSPSPGIGVAFQSYHSMYSLDAGKKTALLSMLHVRLRKNIKGIPLSTLVTRSIIKVIWQAFRLRTKANKQNISSGSISSANTVG